jgi:hypothetical protein
MFLGVLPWLACAVYSGADAHAVAPPHAGLLVFLWGPAAVTCALTAIVLRVIDHWRERILGRESVAQASDA